MTNPLLDHTSRLSADAKRALATAVGTTPAGLHQIAHAYRSKGVLSLTPDLAARIEAATGGTVLREQCCQACGRCDLAMKARSDAASSPEAPLERRVGGAVPLERRVMPHLTCDMSRRIMQSPTTVKEIEMATTYDLYYDDTQRRPWTFNLLDDDGSVVFESKQYKTKAAAASVASRMLK